MLKSVVANIPRLASLTLMCLLMTYEAQSSGVSGEHVDQRVGVWRAIAGSGTAASVQELEQRERELSSELRKVRAELSSLKQRARSSTNQKSLNLDAFLKDLNRSVGRYGDLATTAQKQKFAKDLRDRIKATVEGVPLSLQVKVKNVRVPKPGRAGISVEWKESIPFLKIKPVWSSIHARTLTHVYDLEIPEAEAIEIVPGEIITLRGTLKYAHRESVSTLVAGMKTRFLKLYISDRKHSGELGVLHLTKYSCTVRRTGMTYKP